MALDADGLYTILSDERFLRMEGLSNEVPFFVYAYDIKKQQSVYQRITGIAKRLTTAGIKPLLLGLYDMIVDMFQEAGDWEELLAFEKTATKEEFLKQLTDYINPDDCLKPYLSKKLAEDSYRLILMYQAGETYPFLRSHNLLNNIQTVAASMPLVLFFPGEYVTSYEHGFELRLFGRLEGPYYRAFKLEDYVKRGGLSHEA